MNKKIRLFWENSWNKGHLRLYLATILVTLGVYLSFPEMGFSATLPWMLLFSAASFFLFPKLWFAPVASLAIAYFYGLMAALPDSVSFGFFSALFALCGSFCSKMFWKGLGNKKILSFVLCFAFLLTGIALGSLYLGTPWEFLSQEKEGKAYLAETYPDQEFFDIRFHREYRKEGYRATVSYDYSGNTLTSELFFGEKGEVEDAFFTAFTDFLAEKQKTNLIEVFQENKFSLITEISSFPKEEMKPPYPGKYGQENEEWQKKMHFSVTFREEHPQRREFALACGEVVEALREEEVLFGSITFYGLDGGNPILRCRVLPDTPSEEILSLVVANS